MQKLFAVLQLIRITNGLISAFSICVFLWILDVQNPFSIELISLFLICLFSLSAGNVINDIFDIEIDRINRPNRPLVSGQLQIKTAWTMYILFLFANISLMTQLSAIENGLIVFNNILLFLYSYRLKAIALIGNLSVAYLSASLFILFGLHLAEFEITSLFTLFAFFIHLIRELVKDLADLSGDQSASHQNFALKFGVNSSKRLLTFLIFLFAVVQYYLIIVYDLNSYVLIAVILVSISPQLISIPLIYRSKAKGDYDKVSHLYKLVMFLGLLSFMLIRL